MRRRLFLGFIRMDVAKELTDPVIELSMPGDQNYRTQNLSRIQNTFAVVFYTLTLFCRNFYGSTNSFSRIELKITVYCRDCQSM